jgi:lipopolysaccharide exporter
VPAVTVPPSPVAPTRKLARTAVRGGAWTIATGLGTRLVGVVGTLILTRFMSPYDYGEVAAAFVIAWTANQFSSINVGTYILAHRDRGHEAVFHATFVHLLLGAAAFGLVLLIGGRFGPALEAPTVGRYLPGAVLVLVLERLNYMPERLLTRDLRFGPLSMSRGAGELAYTVVSIATAVAGWGGMAVVAGGVARSALRLVLAAVLVGWRSWLAPTRIRARALRELFGFGLPSATAGLARFGLRRWDNLVISRFYGPAVMGAYNLAYNLADIPAVQVGEQISDVLQAAFARTEGKGSREALVRSAEMLAFIMTPMAVGLACIAPTLSSTMFDQRWAGVGPMLMVLAVISFTRPLGDTIEAYLQIRKRPTQVAILEVGTLALLMGGLWTMGRLGPTWACLAVGLAFAVRLILSAVMVRGETGLRAWDFLRPTLPPIAACLPMALGVLGTSRLLSGPLHRTPALLLVVEVVAGAAGYAVGAMLFARRQVRALIVLLRQGLARAH